MSITYGAAVRRSVATLALTTSALSAQTVQKPVKAAGSPLAGTMYLHIERIALPDGGFATAERAIYFAPVNRTDPKGDVIGIEVYRFRGANEKARRAPPIFRLNGGPNFQGMETPLRNRGYYEREVRPFLDAADFVVIGQRGIGSSHNTTCEATKPLPASAGAADRSAAFQEANRACQAFWRSAGFDLGGLTVMEAAADVEDIRRALGYAKMQIWGGSFGSHWGMAVMRYYPASIERAVLRGLEGPDHTYDSPGGIARSLERIAAAADTSTTLRPAVPPGGLYNAFKAILTRLAETPVTVELRDSAAPARSVRVTADAVREIAVTSARAWPALIIAMHNGDFTQAARAVERRNGRQGLQTASYYMLDCGSGISAARDSALLADPGVALVGERNREYRLACPVWLSDNGDAFRQNFQTTIPTLFVQGDWDVSTPPENSRELAPFFKNLHYVSVKGGSHGALIEAIRAVPSFRQQLMEFFASGDISGMPAEVVLPPVQWLAPTRGQQ